MTVRRRFDQTRSLEERLAEEAERLRKEAELLPPGRLREEVLRKARRADTGSHMSEWLRSPVYGRPSEVAILNKLDGRAIANMDLALEQVCRVFPHGGDHEQRKYVTQKMILSAFSGNTTFDGLSEVASHAVEELSKAKQKRSKR